VAGGNYWQRKKLNDEFTYRYKEFHFTRQRVVEMVPEQKIVWLVTESQINYAEDINEWSGTKVIFEISKEGNKTRLYFTHMGLNPEIECFDSCSNSWSQIIQQSLYSLITAGQGQQLNLA
jgi:activator of Hsp90 ATPase-like protein